jgi:hypothetical protein
MTRRAMTPEGGRAAQLVEEPVDTGICLVEPSVDLVEEELEGSGIH